MGSSSIRPALWGTKGQLLSKYYTSTWAHLQPSAVQSLWGCDIKTMETKKCQNWGHLSDCNICALQWQSITVWLCCCMAWMQSLRGKEQSKPFSLLTNTMYLWSGYHRKRSFAQHHCLTSRCLLTLWTHTQVTQNTLTQAHRSRKTVTHTANHSKVRSWNAIL